MTRSLATAAAIVQVFFYGLGTSGAAHATWSIVAVDPETREVGVAGASCIGGVEAIAGLVPGVGVVAAQALLHGAARDHAVERLGRGDPPQAILDQIASEAWDPAPWHRLGGSGTRQYSIVALEGPHQATFTGRRTWDWAGTRTAPGVAVAGNMLANEGVVEAALGSFLDPHVDCAPRLADRLLAALLAGAEAGGDRRCVSRLGSLSAFAAVARPDDAPDAPSLSLLVPYRGLSELVFFPIRRIWPKRGDAEQNPVRILIERYLSQRPQACLRRPTQTP